MKILVLSNKVPYPANDGSSIAIESMIDGLMANHSDLYLLSINTNKHYKSKNDILNNKPEKLKIEWVNLNTDIKIGNSLKNLLGNQAFHISRFWSEKFENKLAEILKANKFDIIQLEGLAMAVYLPFIRKNSNAKISLRAHNVEFQIWERTAENEANIFLKYYLRLQVKRLKKFELQTLNKIDALVSITAADLETFRSYGFKGKAMDIPCGIDIKGEYKKQGSRPIYDISYLASFDWKPNVQGLEWFLNFVWPILSKKSRPIKMAIAGRHIPEKFESLDIPGLEIVGEVDSMPDFISSSKINIIPLLAGSGMRIKIIENMALSRPMVSTTIGAEGILVKNGRDILLEDEPEPFADAILQLLENEKLRNDLGREARKTIEKNYSNRYLGEKLLKFYKNL